MYGRSNEAVFLLDLCIFAYHLHSQTLIWPMDPYYERFSQADFRKQFMQLIHQSSQTFLNDGQVPNVRPLYRGPGAVAGDDSEGWSTNPILDPIVSRYDLIYPWMPGFTRPEPGQWIVYNTPKEITDRIAEVNMVRYSPAAGPYSASPQVEVDRLYAQHPVPEKQGQAKNLLYCFEGGTGAYADKNRSETPASWSMMGYVMTEAVSGQGDDYDVFVAFRGSRSGVVRFTQSKAIRSQPKGNPDWATDLNYAQTDISEVNAVTTCSLGNGLSMKRTLPTVVKCLTEIHAKKQKPPRRIYITGHSLGGALAIHFTSAMLFGSPYGYYHSAAGQNPAGQQPEYAVLLQWPWNSARLVTFGSPAVEQAKFRELFSTFLPSSRIWLKGDPITIEGRHFPIGQAYRIPPTGSDESSPFKKRHSPDYIRRNLRRDLEKNPLQFDGVPPLEPWVEFSSFEEVLKYFFQTHNDQKVSLSVHEFKQRFLLYIRILESLPSPATKLAVKNLRNFLEKDLPDDVDELLTRLEAAAKLVSGLPLSDEWKIDLKGCLLLVGLAKNGGLLAKDRSKILDKEF